MLAIFSILSFTEKMGRLTTFLVVSRLVLFCYSVALGQETPSTESVFEDLKKDLTSTPEISKQREILRLFIEHDTPETASYLLTLLNDKRASPSLKEEALQVLSGLKNSEARALVKEAATSASEISRQVLEAYIGQGDPESRIFLLRLIKESPSPRLQALAIDGVSRLNLDTVSEGYVSALIDLMKNNEAFHGVRRAAAKALGMIPSRTAIPELILMLKDPLLTLEARDSLLRLTGEEYWTDQSAWIEWWKTNQTTFSPKLLSNRSFNYKNQMLSELLGAGSEFTASFYGRGIEGKKILFILDTSGSMTSFDRILILRSEMTGIIQSLTEAYEIGILTFPQTRFPGKDFGVADQKFRERSLGFIDEMKPQGDTPMAEALEYAFDRIIPRHGVDTVYLLSDGVPSDLGTRDLPDFVLGLNEKTGATIHTIFINTKDAPQPILGQPQPPAIANAFNEMTKKAEKDMAQIAQDSGGSFRSIE